MEGLCASRKFQLYCVGLPKAGTKSISEIFAAYRSYHEPNALEFLAQLVQFLNGKTSKDAMKEILLQRDLVLCPEVDSSHFYVYVTEMLVSLFPHAKFLLTIRDPLGWINSFINFTFGRDPHPIWGEYRDIRMRATPSYTARETALSSRGLYPLSAYFQYWATHIQTMLEVVPTDRLMVLTTSELSQSLEDIAAFVDVPLASLKPERSHSHKGTRRLGILEELDRTFLFETCLFHCGELMRVWFKKEYLELVSEQASSRAVIS
jgi:hypothetical protein